MATPARLGIFLAALAVVFAGAYAVGAALDEGDEEPAPATTVAPHAEHTGPTAGTTTP